MVIVFTIVTFTGCTENQRANAFGKTIEINLPAGKKLVNATWKTGNNLWYLTRNAKSDEKPETLEFTENSSVGMLNGKVIFHEQ